MLKIFAFSIGLVLVNARIKFNETENISQSTFEHLIILPAPEPSEDSTGTKSTSAESITPMTQALSIVYTGGKCYATPKKEKKLNFEDNFQFDIYPAHEADIGTKTCALSVIPNVKEGAGPLPVKQISAPQNITWVSETALDVVAVKKLKRDERFQVLQNLCILEERDHTLAFMIERDGAIILTYYRPRPESDNLPKGRDIYTIYERFYYIVICFYITFY